MFYRIINEPPSFPPNFSAEACDVIRGLLTVSEAERLSSTSVGAKDIMQSAFFSTIDFDALYRKELNPPFIPDLVNEVHIKYVSNECLQTEACDSLVDNTNGEVYQLFEAFEFSCKSAPRSEFYNLDHAEINVGIRHACILVLKVS